ncbi:13086_t:CDS:1 [Racocetra fulgida]|uniref:Uncharacterized protein n=2 Tax=Gigasporaceae TaxID=36753 RepID=A0A397U3Y5_9GLOM|nr:hypothetical protein C2G38_2148810 [Gigaspora rosea]CAG8489339.1 15139_t:CDS:1 [Gigaspora rosea]CAG8559848.1 13086_t:CDS:1 [Racocetra fulgida]
MSNFEKKKTLQERNIITISKLDQVFKKFNNANEIFKKAENEYIKSLNETFKVACASDDYESAFKLLQLIQNKGNNFTKSQVKNKMGMRLLGGFGCQQDIEQARKLITEASNLGLTSASAWISLYGSKLDFGASEVIGRNMI